MNSHKRMRGFSLVELMISLAVLMIASAIFTMGMQPVLKNMRVTNAYNLTLSVLRQTRDISISQRQVYYATFNSAASPNTLTITRGSDGAVMNSYSLPSDVSYQVLTGFPAAAPDGFGTGVTAIDFDQGVGAGAKNIIYFCPDGSGQDVSGNINNGVVYIARTGDMYSARAITLWGATGRLRGWHTDRYSNAWYWREQ